MDRPQDDFDLNMSRRNSEARNSLIAGHTELINQAAREEIKQSINRFKPEDDPVDLQIFNEVIGREENDEQASKLLQTLLMSSDILDRLRQNGLGTSNFDRRSTGMFGSGPSIQKPQEVDGISEIASQ